MRAARAIMWGGLANGLSGALQSLDQVITLDEYATMSSIFLAHYIYRRLHTLRMSRRAARRTHVVPQMRENLR